MVLVILMARGLVAQTLDFDGLKNLAAGTPIWVTTADKPVACVFQNADGDTLRCATIQSDDDNSAPEVKSYRREEVRAIQMVARSEYGKLVDNRGWLDFVVAAGGGAAADQRNQPNIYAGMKIGMAITLDLNYDCVGGHNGFSIQNAGMIPLLRYPGFVPGKKQRYARLYAEPGVGYRFGEGPFGAYTTAGALILLPHPPDKAAPYVEYVHRFPFGSPWQGDNRIAFGVMMAVPQGSGVE
ncbi:MAG TPA: hypothetical protein VGJ21_09710 [Terracidiphilus sp.]